MIEIEDLPALSSVIRYFEDISSIPRASGNTEGIAEYLTRFAEKRGLPYIRDEANNVIIKKCASAGYEAHPTVILQGHSDMVAEKLAAADIDMKREGLRLYRDGDYLCAEGTTLGADDGIAVAYMLAILDSHDYKHPPLECVFTSDEEIGLLGAAFLDGSHLSGRMMINLDSDEEGIFTAGCAGGMRADIVLPIKRETCEGECYRLTLSGLFGGHSGIDINQGRENAIKLLCECLADMGDVRISSLSGGAADNAIPRECEAHFYSCMDFSELLAVCERSCDVYRVTESEISLILKRADCSVMPLDKICTDKVLSLIKEEPTGVIAMSGDIAGLVETSLNMGIARLHDDYFELSFSIRSSVKECKHALFSKVEKIALSFGALVTTSGDYPGWAYRQDSPLRDLMCKKYKKLYGRDAEITIIHAGLECGLFSKKLSGLDCISLGPDNLDIHTPEERLSLPSAERVFNFLLSVLRDI